MKDSSSSSIFVLLANQWWQSTPFYTNTKRQLLKSTFLVAIGERGILQKERTAERKTTKQESEEMDDRDANVEWGDVWISDMDHEKRGQIDCFI